jgi:hypothetical protein
MCGVLPVGDGRIFPGFHFGSGGSNECRNILRHQCLNHRQSEHPPPAGRRGNKQKEEKTISALENTGRLRYNGPMEQNNIKTMDWQPKNPHDRFCRQTIFRPEHASDFLKSFGDPVLKTFVDLDCLQAAPTTHLSNDFREMIMDASLTTRLLDTQSRSEVLFHLEHKSRPSRTVALQLLVKAGMSLHSRWLSSGRPEWGTFEPPIPLMVVVYNGKEDWDGEIWFHDLFPELPEELRPFVPQFRVVFINLRRFKYGSLPGKPETQSMVESMMRATDGTFAAHLPDVLQHVVKSDLDEYRRDDLTIKIAFYSMWAGEATTEQINNAITTAYNTQEATKMIETIKNSILLEGIEIGKEKGKIEEKINDILDLLRIRHKQVPDSIVAELNGRKDLIALKSLFEVAAQCNSIEEFADALK